MPLDRNSIKWDEPAAPTGIVWDSPPAKAPATAPEPGLSKKANAYRLSSGKDEPGVVEEFAGGAKHALDRAAMSLKSYLPESVQRAGDWVDEKIQGKKVMTPELIEQGKKFVEETGPASTIGEIAGEAALTAPIGGVVGKAGQVLTKAVPMLGRVGAAASGIPALAARGAAEGALSNVAMGGGDPESALSQAGSGAAMGGAAGAAIPFVTKVLPKAAGKAWQAFSPSESAAGKRALNVLEESVGGTQALEDLANRARAPQTGSLPQTLAARTQDTQLGALERGARNRGTSAFKAHDAAVDEAAWKQLQNITDTPAVKGTPSEIYAEGQKILDKLPLSQKNRELVSQQVAALRKSNEVIANPELNREFDRVLAAMDHPDATLGVLPQLYTSLDSAAANSPAIREVKGIIKNVADERSKGQFSNVLQGYGATKDAIKAAEAAQSLRGAYDGTAGMGEIPQMKSAPLQRRLAKEVAKDTGYLDPDKVRQADKLAGELRGREIYKDAVSPGSTVPEIGEDAGTVSLVKSVVSWPVRAATESYRKGLDHKTLRQFDEALLNPEKFIQMVDQKKAAKAALEPWERKLDTAIRGTARAAAVQEQE